jgi:hypothetical protein
LPGAGVWAGGFALAGLALSLVVGPATPGGAEQPRQNFLFYSQDADAGTAAWVAQTNLPDDTLAPWLGDMPRAAALQDFFPGGWNDRVYVQAAPPSGEPAAELTVLSDVTSGQVRTLRLRLSSPRRAWSLLAEASAVQAILAVELYGERFVTPAPRGSVFLKVVGVPAEGVEVAVDLLAGVPLQIRLGDVSLALPAFEGQPVLTTSPWRTGYGGGHGIDGMLLIHRQYTFK